VGREGGSRVWKRNEGVGRKGLAEFDRIRKCRIVRSDSENHKKRCQSDAFHSYIQLERLWSAQHNSQDKSTLLMVLFPARLRYSIAAFHHHSPPSSQSRPTPPTLYQHKHARPTMPIDISPTNNPPPIPSSGPRYPPINAFSLC
jgi:hypothetical protein